MIIKRRGWIGNKIDIESIVSETKRGEIRVNIENVRGNQRGWAVDDGVDRWPPRQVEVTIEVKEVQVCGICRKPYEGGMTMVPGISGWVHDECPNECPNIKKKKSECPDRKIHKLKLAEIPPEICGPDVFDTIKKSNEIVEKINELVERVNEVKK